MYKIIFIDGGESGRRVQKLTDTIRQYISKEELTIHRSISRLNTNNEYHSLKGYDIAFIHNSDNINEKLEPVFTMDAKANNIPLVLYSGGIRGFRFAEANTCEINDTLLMEKVSPFLRYQLNHDFSNIDFNYLFPGENYLILEALLELKLEIINNYESADKEHSLLSLHKLMNYFEDLGLLNKNNKIIELASDLFNNFAEIISAINKSILKFEKSITFK
jgi:hypothetical protein